MLHKKTTKKSSKHGMEVSPVMKSVGTDEKAVGPEKTNQDQDSQARQDNWTGGTTKKRCMRMSARDGRELMGVQVSPKYG